MTTELEQFCVVARSQKDRACAAIIQQVLKDKRIYVFGELLSIPSVQALQETEFSNALTTLELFAYGSYDDYLAEPTKYLELNAVLTQKLRRLTLLSVAATTQNISYSQLLAALHLQSVRELEDFIIDTIYSGLVSGKIDQNRQLLRVSAMSPRDVRPEAVDDILQQLTAWKNKCGIIKELLQNSNSEIDRRRQDQQHQQAAVQAEAERQKEGVKDRYESGMMDVDSEDFSSIMGGGRKKPMSRAGIDRFTQAASRGFGNFASGFANRPKSGGF